MQIQQATCAHLIVRNTAVLMLMLSQNMYLGRKKRSLIEALHSNAAVR